MVGASPFEVGDEEHIEPVGAGDFCEIAVGIFASEFHEVEVSVGGVPALGFQIDEAGEVDVNGCRMIAGEIEFEVGGFGFEAGDGGDGEFFTGERDLHRTGEDGPVVDAGIGFSELRRFEAEASGEEFGGMEEGPRCSANADEAGDFLL